MQQVEELIKDLRTQSIRLTALRRSLIEIFCDARDPLAYNDLLGLLSHKNLHPNKTSIYRELDFLIEQEIIQEVSFGERKKRYELAGCHHHHLVCQSCDKIEAVHLDDHLSDHESKILKEKKFKVTRHMLEFFGLCGVCQEKGKL